jgi:hypothetical protein
MTFFRREEGGIRVLGCALFLRYGTGSAVPTRVCGRAAVTIVTQSPGVKPGMEEKRNSAANVTTCRHAHL